MADLLLLVRVSFRQALKTRVFWLVFLGAAILAGADLANREFFRVATAAGEWERVAEIRVKGASQALELWGSATVLIGLVLGATAIGADRRSGVLELLLTRPIDRRRYLLGRWLGLELFLLVFLSVVFAVSLLALRLPALHPTPVFWLGLAEIVVQVTLVTALGFAFGTVLRPVPAAIWSVLLVSLPSLGASLAARTDGWVHALGAVLYLLGPAEMQENLLRAGLTEDALAPEYGLKILVLIENLLYAAMALALSGVVFRRRDPL
ncbi:MAG: ABC transporter permease subunit [Acidobacteriota bacterium]